MRQHCPDCQRSYNDEYCSTVCPHRGIGHCAVCDCVVCVCSPETCGDWERTQKAGRTTLPGRINRFEYLVPAIGPVIDGLEESEKIYALDQMKDYTPIRTLPGENGKSAIYRFELTPDQRQMVAEGADVLVEILHFNGPLAPSKAMLVNQKNFQPGESKEVFAGWFAVQAKCPIKF